MNKTSKVELIVFVLLIMAIGVCIELRAVGDVLESKEQTIEFQAHIIATHEKTIQRQAQEVQSLKNKLMHQLQIGCEL